KSTTSGSGNSGMTGGIVARSPALPPDDLDGHVAVARPVELGGDDGLELPEHELALGHGEGKGVAEEGGLQVRGRGLAVAVGVLRIVVAPFVLGAHDLVEHALDVVEEGGLPLVH